MSFPAGRLVRSTGPAQCVLFACGCLAAWDPPSGVVVRSHYCDEHTEKGDVCRVVAD